ncbi:MAG: hypothetical protein K2Q12_02755 [Rickettsiales bacterium]|nr:hypothetical protein [Rickettsiales bacterium]
MAESAQKNDVSNTTATEVAAPAVVLSSDKSKATLQQLHYELEARLKSQSPAIDLHHQSPNQLGGRYLIKTDEMLENYSKPQCPAYAVTDMSGQVLPLFAVVCDSGLPYRHTSMEKLLGYDHPHLIRLIDHGIVMLSALSEQRHVLIFEQPSGKRLTSVIAEGYIFNEQLVHDQIVMPLSSVLNALDELGISHCHIHPDNIYIGEKLTLGECVSQPAGFSQNFLYEPVERITALPQGKGAGSPKVDLYAIGVMVIEILYNLNRPRALSHEQYISMLLQQGCYNVLAGNGEFSEYFHDLLRGSLCDDPMDRWGPAQLAQWITGKRFNIIHPSTPREASRPFSFEGKDYFSRKALTHAFYTHWETAKNFIRTSKVERWLEQSIQMPDDAAMVTQIFSMSASANKSVKRANEMLSRIMIVLDPYGPIRSENLAFNTDAIGKMLSEAMYNKRQNDLNLLVDVILNDLPHYWTERQKSRLTQEVQDSLYKIQSARPNLTINGFGFGLERCLYDLNHDLPCYSTMLKGLYITSLSQLMIALDALAIQHGKDFSLMDRHLTAFAASKAMINGEIRFHDIASYAPELANSKELQVLQLFAKAQQKSGVRSLPGLSIFFAMSVATLIENIHSRRIREVFVQKTRQAVDSGNLQDVLNVVLDSAQLTRDFTGYNAARDIFARNQMEINKLRDKDLLKKKVMDRAHRWSSLVSVFLFLITCAFVLKDLVG